MADRGVDVLLLSVGADLPWLCGYEAMPLERLTMLVVPRDGDATLVVPALEAPRVVERPGLFAVRPWNESEDPVALVAGLVGRAGVVAVGDRTWARFLVDLQAAVPGPDLAAGVGGHRPAAGGQGRPRDRGAAAGRPGRGPRGGRAALRCRPARGPCRGRRLRRPRAPSARRRATTG